jgi:hypothetical protein
VNFFRGIVCDVFNSHTSLFRVDESSVCSGAVKGKGEVKLTINADLFDNINSAAGEAISTGLFGDEGVSKHVFGNTFHLIRCVNDMNSTLESSFFEMAKTTTASKHLGLNDVSITFKSAGNLVCLIRGAGNVSKRDTNLVRVKEGSGLVLVELHTAEGQGGFGNESAVEDAASLLGEHKIINVNY